MGRRNGWVSVGRIMLNIYSGLRRRRDQHKLEVLLDPYATELGSSRNSP